MIRSLLLHFASGVTIRGGATAFAIPRGCFHSSRYFTCLALGILGGDDFDFESALDAAGVQERESTAELAGEVRPWMIGSLAVMLVSGFLLFSTEAVKMYGNWAFQFKMLFLLLAVIYTFTIHRRVTLADDGRRFGAGAPCVRRDCVAVVVVGRRPRGPRARLHDHVRGFGRA